MEVNLINYENKPIRVVTKSGAIIEGNMKMINSTSGQFPLFETATIEVGGSKRECKSVSLDFKEIEIIGFLD